MSFPLGEDFKPKEPYTHRLRKILEEYPDGSQVIREILQNSDDAQSTEQIFILDHNKYPSNKLFNQQLDRYQGPALISKNTAIFEEDDFKSLLNLADSKKSKKFDKIGAMGIGFNSIYHITDSPSFITGNKYVILDPHERCYNGGVQFDFVGQRLAESFPDQFAPFKKILRDEPFKEPFNGTIFRYPLRNSTESDISDKVYKPKEILDMFQKFYEHESINCLLFLKYIECISFYVLGEGADEPELLYKIRLENANEVRKSRRLISENIALMMNSSNTKELETSYVASFYRQKGGFKEPNSEWLILNYLDDLLNTKKIFNNNISLYKFIPNVGLAVPLKDFKNVTGKLFCFLPLPISMPFLVSVHGYFAVSTNRRSLWSPTENEDLADDASMRLKAKWNLYLFENVLPKAWAKFLCVLPNKVPNIQLYDLYEFWPIVKESTSSSMGIFCKNLLQNVTNCLNLEDRVFKGLFGDNWLSLSCGYLEDEKLSNFNLSKIIGNIGFPVISTLCPIIEVLKNSRHQDSIKFFSPAIIRIYLNNNRARWENILKREEILLLFEYILRELNDQNIVQLEGLKIIPLADGVNLGTLTQFGNPYVYIDPDVDIKNHENDEHNIFTNQLDRFIDKSIDFRLYKCLYDNANAGWNLNIKILDEFAVADMIKFSLNFAENVNYEEVQMSNHREWIYKLWDNILYRNWDLSKFEDIHLIPTNHFTLRKLKTSSKIFSSQNVSSNSLISTFEKFGAVFVDSEFDNKQISERNKLSPYIIKLDNIISILDSFQANTSYPENLKKKLHINEASTFAEHLSNYLRLTDKNNLMQKHIDVIKHLPIFTEVDRTSPISLIPKNKEWYLLPRDEENSYGKIIYPRDKGGFIDASSQSMCYLLEDIIKIPRLTINDYWKEYVIPFLELQIPRNINKVIDKLFNRLPSFDADLKNDLGRRPFIPACTLRMSQQYQTPEIINLAKPMELFDPEARALTNVFFEDEQLFPAGRYGNPQKYLPILKSLGIKSVLTPNDIIFRIDIIMKRRQTFNEELVHIKAFNLLKYIDDNWDQLTCNNATLETILETEWIPTVDKFGSKLFSKPEDCYCKKYEDLVCLTAPVLEYNLENNNFLKFMNWDIYPDVKTVLRQLKLCRDSVTPPNAICNAIYKYMNEIFQIDETSFYFMKESLRNEPWILCGEVFRSSDKVVVNLPNQFQDNDSLIVKLPVEYYVFEDLLKNMGVRDEVGIIDLIEFIKSMVKENRYKVLTAKEINNVVMILKRIIEIRKDNKGNEKELDGLLIPSNNNILVELSNILFDDMKNRLGNEEKCNYEIVHDSITRDIAEELGIQTLKGTVFVKGIYGQVESLTTKIENIAKDYSINSVIKEFLRDADDTGAKQFLIIVDERQYDSPEKSFLSEEIQGPTMWIYYDVEFTNDSFQSLLNLDMRSLNCAFHITDLLSFVSGRYIVFLDPNAKFLPPSGFPLKKPNSVQIDFIEKKFKKSFPEQCHPYEEIFYFIEKKFPDKYAKGDCDMSKKFEGTLFRLPLRTSDLTKNSVISIKTINVDKITKIFNNIQENNEMLFLRNIESCSLYRKKNRDVQFNIDSYYNSRRKMIDNAGDVQIYQSDIERMNHSQKKVSEIWAICTGEHSKIKPVLKELGDRLRKFSEENRLKPRGGVAYLLAQSDAKSFDELRNELLIDPPELEGKIYSHLSLPISTNLGVHLNGDFSINMKSAENIFLKVERDSQDNCDDVKWDQYILYDVLPDLHVKLLDYIVELEENRHKQETNFLPPFTDNLWPINDLYKNYGLNVIKKLGSGDHRIFWTKANGGKLISLENAKILEDETIVDILISLGVSAVKLDRDKIEELNKIVESGDPPNFLYEPITGESVCEILCGITDICYNLNHPSLFKLLEFILQDKNSYEFLTGLPLVPLSDGSVGKFGQIYYIGKKEHLKLFPNTGPPKFVSIDLPKKLFEIFNDDSFPAYTNIKKFDASALLDLLMFELRPSKERQWDPNGSSIPNENWLKRIWQTLSDLEEEREFTRLFKYPLLPVIQPSKLIRLDMKYPVLHVPEQGQILYPILLKLQVRLTNLKFPDNAHENFKKCTLSFTPLNIINSLKISCSLSNKTMEQLFKTGNLSLSDYDKFRRFIKKEFNSLIGHGQRQKNFMDTLRSLPIWPIHHGKEGKFIDAMSGKLLTHKLPFFSFRENTDFYKCDQISDFQSLTILRLKQPKEITYMNELNYFKYHIVPDLENFPPSKDYINFLKEVLYLGKKIDDLKQYKMIPNKLLTAFARADTLYDNEIILFLNTFDNDKFLPPELQNDPICLEALERIGLNRKVNCNTFIECAREIESQFQQPDQFPTNIVKNRARYLMNYLYTHTFGFSNNQWNEIMHIRFIPSEMNLQSPFQEEAKETMGYESFAMLCFQRYKEVCWTVRPLFERSVEPERSFCERYPTIGKPSFEEIVEHWFFFVEEIKSKIIWNSSDIKSIMKEIYKIMNEFSQDDIMKGLIKLKINDPNKKVFLNGDDPLDEKNWVAGKELVFGIQEDIKEGMYKVNTFLMPYKDLLLLAGAYEINIEELEELEKSEKLKKSEKNTKIDQKEILVNDLLDKLTKQSIDEYHDVFFTFDKGKERIGANRYVLSAASSYFKRMFYSGLSESLRDEIEVSIKGIHPDIFWILLRWLYGQSFEDAIKSVLRNPNDFNRDQYLSFLINLLQVTDIYDVESLKDKVEDTIIKGRYIGVRNLCKILISSEEFNAQQLKNYYEKHIISNRNLVKEQLLKLHTNAANDAERLEISQMSQLLNCKSDRYVTN
ncbi:hypothetical protein RclHR1_07770002 [Rhizophagus clarus]|uniref:BTB domain-containing protein n=1 Tax=Rhizophagus clarus TaxID=94130 RepID=A0A2Z6SDW3_9GLOM|nr:hypothetical protein RclHR1_07770002 [Rhizophagus clarus]GES91933.1 hypothetical protein GLOIN_2v1794928 [Rhizophagus clarus]